MKIHRFLHHVLSWILETRVLIFFSVFFLQQYLSECWCRYFNLRWLSHFELQRLNPLQNYWLSIEIKYICHNLQIKFGKRRGAITNICQYCARAPWCDTTLIRLNCKKGEHQNTANVFFISPGTRIWAPRWLLDGESKLSVSRRCQVVLTPHSSLFTLDLALSSELMPRGVNTTHRYSSPAVNLEDTTNNLPIEYCLLSWKKCQYTVWGMFGCSERSLIQTDIL